MSYCSGLPLKRQAVTLDTRCMTMCSSRCLHLKGRNCAGSNERRAKPSTSACVLP